MVINIKLKIQLRVDVNSTQPIIFGTVRSNLFIKAIAIKCDWYLGVTGEYKIIGKSRLTSCVFGSSSAILGSESFTSDSFVRDQLEGAGGRKKMF